MRFLLVLLGGGLGALVRYMVSIWWSRSVSLTSANTLLSSGPSSTMFASPFSWSTFPWPTVMVNLLGCFLIGLVIQLTANTPQPSLRLFLVTGFLGGLTTFSTFGLEGIQLIQQGQPVLAVAYIGGQVILGLLLVLLGFWVGSQLHSVMG